MSVKKSGSSPRIPRSSRSASVSLELSPGVRAGRGAIRTAEDAALRAVKLAAEAGRRGTFGVGGLLVHNSGRIIAEATNAVIRDGRLADPTAHVERQLVDWFARARREGLSASARDLTIVSSLDPCAMCAGAILRSGLRVVVVAEDDQAGVHYKLQPDRMPRELNLRARKRMAFLGVRGRRPAPHKDVAKIFSSEISPELVDRSIAVFVASLDEVRRRVGGSGSDAGPRDFQPGSEVLSRLQTVASQLGPGIKTAPAPLNVHDAAARPRLMRILARDSSVLVDENGNVIFGSAGSEGSSRARTSVLELIRAYPLLRRAMAEQFGIELPHQRYCSIVKRTAPGAPDKGLLELGATGSFLEVSRPTTKLPAMGYIDSENLASARQFAASLPPFYASIGIAVGQIALKKIS